PLTVRSDGWLRLGGEGRPVDWVIRMRRLPAERMFDRMLRDNTWSMKDIEALEECLRHYYASAPAVHISGPAYCRRLRAGILNNCEQLLAAEPFGIDVGCVIQTGQWQE